MSPELAEAMARLRAGGALKKGQMTRFVTELMEGKLEENFTVDFLTALRQKGESVDDIIEAATVMRAKCVKVSVAKKPLLDTCGTGGDGAHTLNVSTLVALVAAAAGVAVAKHGNRSVSGLCGSADLLDALGVRIDLTAEQVARCIETTGFGFMYAPNFHPAMKHAAPARKKITGRTLFNCLGPLTNPAGATHHLLGVYSESLVQPVCKALGALGAQHAIVVHGRDGLDEVSITQNTVVAEGVGGKVTVSEFKPSEVGFAGVKADQLRVKSVEDALASARLVLEGRPGPKTDFVVLNAAFALKAADVVRDIKEGVARSRKLLESQAVQRKLDQIKTFKP